MQLVLPTFLLFLFIAVAYSYNCFDCSNCVTCTSVSSFTSVSKKITLSTKECKDDTISWVCCRSSLSDRVNAVPESCTLTGCNSPSQDDKEFSKNKCNEVTHLEYAVPIDAVSVTIQLHDGSFAGDVDCGKGNELCCGGDKTSCKTAVSGVCEVTIDLSTCIGAPKPTPECVADSDCVHFNHECSSGRCSSGTCVEVFSPGSTVCRAAKGVCDVPEYCSGDHSYCPEDKFLPHFTLCRDDVVMDDGTTCDVPEFCTGDSVDCPADTYALEGITCRSKADLCDSIEICDGASPVCPPNIRYDWAYTYKCATTQYLCGVTRGELVQSSGGSYFLGSGAKTCNIGTGSTFVDLEWPACVNLCIDDVCPNDCSLINYAEAHCDPLTGKWQCDNKVDVCVATPLPYCPVHTY